MTTRKYPLPLSKVLGLPERPHPSASPCPPLDIEIPAGARVTEPCAAD